MAMREKAIEAHTPTGSYDGAAYGYRHSLVFEDLVSRSGRLNETMLLVKTVGVFNLPKLIAMIPIAMNAAFRRKVPPLFHPTIPGVGQVRRIAARINASKTEAAK